jgi:hypothetical protein
MLGAVLVGTRDPRWFAVDLDVSYTKGSPSLMVHFSVSDTVLASRQLVPGGWSFASSQQASIEATCLAAFALADEPLANAGASTQFLLKSQFADGCWPAFEGDSEGSWTTALSLCYLNGMTDFASARERAYRWLIEERGREAHWFWRWKFKTTDRNVCFDPDKYGWPWVSGSASWVIPTAFSVIAIKQFTVCNRSELSEERIRLGVEMLLDRACASGGWNSGNSVVYGVPLLPHIEATAIALLALQDEERTPVIRRGLAWLKQRSATIESVESLAWSILSLFAYQEPVDHLKTRLSALIGDGRDIRNNATLATAILALRCGEMIHPFMVLR